VGWLVFTATCVAALVAFGVIGGRRKRQRYDARPPDEEHLSYAEWSKRHGYDDGLIQ
jgi:hypothetical protein